MDDSLLDHVRCAANDLAGELESGRRETGDWADAERSEALVRAALERCLGRLAETGCWGAANRLPSSELWRFAGDWLKSGELQTHARGKPRGYAGDFEILATICEQGVCDDPLGRIFDRYFQQQHAPRAVRNRTQMVAGAIVEVCRRRGSKGCRIASVGSGPAIDVESALRRLSPDERRLIHVTLIDIDPEALSHAAKRLAPLLDDGQLDCARENLFRFARRAKTATWLDGADLISCTGLLDYLEDDDAAPMLGAFWRRLAPCGQLLVFNFAPGNPSRAYMEWIGNWYLNYRDDLQMARLAQAAGIAAGQFSIGAEPLGVNLLIQAEKR